jgi:hypothetical protein
VSGGNALRDSEVHGAKDRDEEFGPDNAEDGFARENGLGEVDEMRRGEDLHGVLQPDRHAFRGVAGPDTNCMGSSVRTRSSANCGMDSANVAKAIHCDRQSGHRVIEVSSAGSPFGLKTISFLDLSFTYAVCDV